MKINKNIIYSNKENFQKTIENMKKWGLEKLHILADFDNTLTKAFVNWQRTPSLVSVVRGKNWMLWEQCALEDTKLYEKYHPIEIDPNISLEEKNKYMLKWWEKSFNLFIKYWLSKEILEEIWKTDLIEFRDWVREFFEFTNKNNIPFIIISASWLWVESIEILLKNHNLNYPNIEIISNNYIWDEYWKAIWFKKPIIHSFNKWETVLKEFPEIYKKIKNRKNVILLWDSLWDHHMVDWFEYENLINIWFLNYKIDELLEEYKKRYDIVITWDWDFSVVNEIVKEI
jgi:5'-nucleotidase